MLMHSNACVTRCYSTGYSIAGGGGGGLPYMAPRHGDATYLCGKHFSKYYVPTGQLNRWDAYFEDEQCCVLPGTLSPNLSNPGPTNLHKNQDGARVPSESKDRVL